MTAFNKTFLEYKTTDTVSKVFEEPLSAQKAEHDLRYLSEVASNGTREDVAFATPLFIRANNRLYRGK
jgi:hypothetical protein